MVGVAELPVENVFIFTASLGMTGAAGMGSSFFGSSRTVGADSSSTFTGVFGSGAGSRKVFTGWSSATKVGSGRRRTVCGS